MAKAHGLISSPKMPMVLDERALDWDDLEQLCQHRGVGTHQLQRIRAIHHQIARMMASGCANVEVSAATGMNQTYLSVLRADPGFQELLSHYEEQENDTWQNVRQQAAMLGMTATQELQGRLMNDPERISTKDLLNVMTAGLDYGGQKPAERSEVAHLHTTAEEISRIKQGRKENVSIRRNPGGDEGESGEDAIDAEYTEAESGTPVREASTGDDRENPSPAYQDPLDGLLG